MLRFSVDNRLVTMMVVSMKMLSLNCTKQNKTKNNALHTAHTILLRSSPHPENKQTNKQTKNNNNNKSRKKERKKTTTQKQPKQRILALSRERTLV